MLLPLAGCVGKSRGIAAETTSNLPAETYKVALEYDNKVYETAFGAITLFGRYVGEGSTNYKMRAVLTCKNGRKIQLFDLKFCDFVNNKQIVPNFTIKPAQSTITFNYYANFDTDMHGNPTCSGGTSQAIRVNCGPR